MTLKNYVHFQFTATLFCPNLSKENKCSCIVQSTQISCGQDWKDPKLKSIFGTPCTQWAKKPQ